MKLFILLFVGASLYAASAEQWCRQLLRSISIYDRMLTAARQDNDMETVSDLLRRIDTINGILETERDKKKKNSNDARNSDDS